jgi:hypothetical protein
LELLVAETASVSASGASSDGNEGRHGCFDNFDDVSNMEQGHGCGWYRNGSKHLGPANGSRARGVGVVNDVAAALEDSEVQLLPRH